MDYSDIVEPFNRFLSAVINMKNYLANRVDPFQHIGQLVNGIFEEIAKLQRDAQIIETKVRIYYRNERGSIREGEWVCGPGWVDE